MACGFDSRHLLLIKNMKLYISDQHFFHENANLSLDKRGFKNVLEMNSYMIEKWNSKVLGGDQIIVLGDMFLLNKNPLQEQSAENQSKKINYVLNRLKGKICLVKGNHDNSWLNLEGVNLNRFEWIKDYAELKDGENLVVLSHYPIFCYNHQYLLNKDGSARTFMLYGHVHNTHDEVLVNEFQNLTRKTELCGKNGNRKIPCNMINCFCMFSDYAPLSLAEWKQVDSARRAKISVPENYVIKDIE